MKKFAGYIRVSTAKQANAPRDRRQENPVSKHHEPREGVSLPEQRDAILAYARRNDIEIVEWYEERKTAAKRGRLHFNELLKRLRQRKLDGVVIHKVDRGARNLGDWAELGELIDTGVEVHFANESLDLQTRGGRLSADLQAVIAADYIRNLREEAKKGIVGRLKQGLYPLYAPLGYINQGRGRRVEVDPKRGPLLKVAFELYARGALGLRALADELYRRGLRSRAGGKIGKTALAKILRNSFYVGVIKLKTMPEAYMGVHDPLISKALFDRVQRTLSGKTNKVVVRHDWLFRRLFTCSACGSYMVGERQKGLIYYRCHQCRGICIRETAIETAITEALQGMVFTPENAIYLKQAVRKRIENYSRDRLARVQSLELRLDQVSARFSRLTDGYLDGVLDPESYQEAKRHLIDERLRLEEERRDLRESAETVAKERVEKILELVLDPHFHYFSANLDRRPPLLRKMFSNREIASKEAVIKPSFLFSYLKNQDSVLCCAPQRTTSRRRSKLSDRHGSLSRRPQKGLNYLADTIIVESAKEEWRDLLEN